MRKIVLFFVYMWIVGKASLSMSLKRLMGKKIIFVLGTPAHSNLGDQAIAYAEMEFLKKYVPSWGVVEVRLIKYELFEKVVSALRNRVKAGDVVMAHGGGNLGDQYPEEEEARRLIVRSFPKNRIIMFPQTIYFKETEAAQKMLNDSIEIYGTHPDLTLVGREDLSYDFMKEKFQANHVVKTPDIVISLLGTVNKKFEDTVRSGAMTCLRKDEEKSTTKGKDGYINSMLEDRFGKVLISDTVSDDKIILFDWFRMMRLNQKWGQFASSEVVVTDRLHGMVFAALTNTPCVVFSNYNHKVSGTHRWIKDLPYIEFCDDVDKLAAAINKVVGKSVSIDKLPTFDEYWARITEKIEA